MPRSKRYTRNLGRRLPAPLPRRTTVAWIRFEHEVEPYGVFCYVDDAREILTGADQSRLDALVAWFERYLDAPDLRGSRRERCWFKAEAGPPVGWARELAALVRKAGIPIVERRTTRVPGKVGWSDAAQVAVITYRDAPRSRRGPAR